MASRERRRRNPLTQRPATPGGPRIDPLRSAEARLWRSLGVAPVERMIRLETLGSTVRVQELGDGPPVLFIHGGTTWGTSWADLVAALPGVRCLLLDRPGTGLSEPLREPVRSIADLRRVADVLVADVLDALDVERADVVATSFGGYFALRAALAHPGRIRRLVMIGWTAGAPVSRLPLMLRVGVAPLIGDIVGRLPVSRAGVRAIFRAIGSGAAIDDGRIGPAAIEAYTELLRTTPSAGNDRALGRLFFSARTGLDARIVLSADERSRIATPVDWLWGGRDAFAGEAIARGFVEPFPEARLTIIPDAGHAPWLDDLAATVRFVEQALNAGDQRVS